MPRDSADALAPDARICLERVRQREAGSELCNGLANVVLFTGLVTALGHGALVAAFLERKECGIGAALLVADETGNWRIPNTLIDDLTTIVNEYDRQVRETRLAIIEEAAEQLERLVRVDTTPILARSTRGTAMLLGDDIPDEKISEW